MFQKTAFAFAALLASSPAWAAPSQQDGPLAPAGSAGVHQAQMFSGTSAFFIVGGTAVVVGTILAISANGGSSTSTSTTGTTPGS